MKWRSIPTRSPSSGFRRTTSPRAAPIRGGGSHVGVDAVGVNSFEGATVTVRTVVLGTARLRISGTRRDARGGPNHGHPHARPAKESDSGDYKLIVSMRGNGRQRGRHRGYSEGTAHDRDGTEAATRLQGSSVTFAVDCGGSSRSVTNGRATTSTSRRECGQPDVEQPPAVFRRQLQRVHQQRGGERDQPGREPDSGPVAADSLAAAVVAADPVAFCAWTKPRAPRWPTITSVATTRV